MKKLCNYAEKEILLTISRIFFVKSLHQIMFTMNLFTQLRHHAQVRPEAVAIYSQERVTTYRKLWSRIERATARLQGEWRIHAGDRVADLGKGHPAAIVLYASLARSGALLVPLKPAMPQSLIESTLRKTKNHKEDHDDD